MRLCFNTSTENTGSCPKRLLVYWLKHLKTLPFHKLRKIGALHKQTSRKLGDWLLSWKPRASSRKNSKSVDFSRKTLESQSQFTKQQKEKQGVTDCRLRWRVNYLIFPDTLNKSKIAKSKWVYLRESGCSNRAFGSRLLLVRNRNAGNNIFHALSILCVILNFFHAS